MAQCAADLRGEPIVQPVDQVADVEADVAAVQAFAPAIAGVEDLLELVGGGDDFVVVRQRAVAEVVDLADLVVGVDDSLGELGKLVFEAKVGGHGGNALGDRSATIGCEGRAGKAALRQDGRQMRQRGEGRRPGCSSTYGARHDGSGVRPDSYRCTLCLGVAWFESHVRIRIRECLMAVNL